MTGNGSTPESRDVLAELRLMREHGYRVVRKRGTPALEQLSKHSGWGAPSRGDLVSALLERGLDRLQERRFERRIVPTVLMQRFLAVDVDTPPPYDDRFRTLVSSLSKERKNGARYRDSTVERDWLWHTERQLAAEMVAMVGEAPRLVSFSQQTREALTKLVIAAALQLIIECNHHGAWPGTAEPAAEPRLSLSVSCWAAAALSKVFGAVVEPWVKLTERCVMSSYSELHGAVGEYRDKVSDTRFIKDGREFVPRPRLTASAIKLMHLRQERSVPVAMCLDYLLDAGKHGFWNEHSYPVKDEPGSALTSAYVLDALLKLEDDGVVPQLRYMVPSRDVFKRIDEAFDERISDGKNWMIRTQNRQTGAWAEVPGGATEPYIAAHVVGFLWQLLARNDEVRERSIRYLEQIASDDGGFPEFNDGTPEIAPTALIVNGLLRIDKPEVGALAQGGIEFLGRCAVGERLPRLDAFTATFVLLLGQYEDRGLLVDDWRDAAIAAIQAFNVARKRRDMTPMQLADATLAPLDRDLATRLRPAVVDILSEPKRSHA